MGESDGSQPKQNEATEDMSTAPEPAPTAADQDRMNPPVNNPPKSKLRRSNEFWLAIAGIAATLLGGALGSFITYQTSSRQLQATADQSALQFNKEQRIRAYADYNDSVTRLGNDEFRVAQSFEQFPQVDILFLHKEFDPYENDFRQNNLYSSTVVLVRSKGVLDAHATLAAKHNDLHNRIEDLFLAAENGDVPTVQTKAKELLQNLDSGASLLRNFIAAAKHDLGMDN